MFKRRLIDVQLRAKSAASGAEAPSSPGSTAGLKPRPSEGRDSKRSPAATATDEKVCSARRRKQLDVLRYFGRIEYDASYNYKRERNRKRK